MNELFGKRILITGAAGFIGSHLIERLAEADCTVLACHHETLPPEGYSVDWTSLDVRDSLAVTEILADFQPNFIVNLAAKSDSSRKIGDIEQFVSVNFNGAYNILNAASRVCTSVERIVLMGSADEYGRVANLPIAENLRTHALSAFAASKASMTHFGRVYHQLFDLPVVTLRPFVVYGPGQTGPTFLPSLIRSIWRGRDFAMTSGAQTRDFVYVTDVVAAIECALTAGRVSGEVFNVCSGIERSLREVAELVISLAGSTAPRLLPGALPYRRNEVWRSCGSREKAERLLNWQPGVDLKEGLRLMLESQPELSDSNFA